MEMYKIMQTFEAINVAVVRNTTVMFTGINQSGFIHGKNGYNFLFGRKRAKWVVHFKQIALN